MSHLPADHGDPGRLAPKESDSTPETALNNRNADNTAKRRARAEPMFGESDASSLFLGWEDDARAASFGFGTSGAKKRARDQGRFSTTAIAI